jgi:raffinose/stachyose/melibiose transport system substrate-binding protein
MRKRSWLLVACAFLLIISTVAGAQTELKFIQYGPEYGDAMRDMAAAYSKVNPKVTIDFTILAGDYFTVFKTRLASGDLPDVFMTGSGVDIKNYAEYSADLTRESWIKNVEPSAIKEVTYNGKILGFPIWSQAVGYIYNKKVFADVGITTPPRTFSELEAACIKIQAKGIIPIANAYQDWWCFEQMFAHFLAKSTDNFADLATKLTNGTVKFSDLKPVQSSFAFFDFTLKYGNPKPLETSFDAQCAMIATGKAAIIHSGDWAEPAILKTNPNAQIGFLGEPTDDQPAKLTVGNTNCWRVTSASKNLAEVKKWLNWFVTSDYGKNFVSQKMGSIGTIKGAKPPNSQLAADTYKFIAAGRTLPWVKPLFPNGFQQDEGAILQKYIAKTATKDQILDEITQSWVKLANAQ